MRVLYLSQYYPPEIGATQSRAHAMARGLVRNGHAVTVLTEIPNHPEGVVHPAYRGRWSVREEDDGIDIVRLPVWTSPRKNAIRRIGFYLSYACGAAATGAFRHGRFDVVFATSPPLFTAAAGSFAARVRRVPFVMEVRDAWPESAVQLGELRSRHLVDAARKLERHALHAARRVVTVTEGLRTRVIAAGVAPERVITIPNGADPERFRPRPAERVAMRARLGIPEDAFVVLYAGLHGLAHGLETAVEAAERLRDDDGIRFLFVGAGPRKEAVRSLAESKGLRHVHFHDAVAEEELSAWMAAADVGLDVRRRLEITREALPVKMFAAMACGLPVLLAIEGEAAELVTRENVGVVVPPEDSAALADAVLALRADPGRGRAMGERGRALVRRGYDRNAGADRLAALLREATEP